MNTAPDIEAAVKTLEALKTESRLWTEPESTNPYEQVVLSDEGKSAVSNMVTMCLEHKIAPYCSVNLDNLTCDDKVVTLSQLHYADLMAKSHALASSAQMKAK